jgi:uncharacterized protein involved in exopolysaccharide biosynthesis
MTTLKTTTANEIDVLDLFRILWKRRKTIFLFLGIFIALGLFVAFLSPKQYKVVTTMLPQGEENMNVGGLSSLASLAGFDLDLSDNSDISPVIFPQIMQSEPFLLKLMHSPYQFKKYKQPVSLIDYATNPKNATFADVLTQYTLGLPAVIKNALKKPAVKGPKGKDDGLTRMTEDEAALAEGLKSAVDLSINKKEGYLTLTCIFNEPVLCAQVAKNAQQLLQEKITEYKTKKAQEQLRFFEKQYLEKKQAYQAAQSRLASYRDRNLFVTTAIGSAEDTRLQNDYNLAYSIYSEMAKQYENAKLKVRRVTPVYLIIKPIVVPNEPFAPKKTLILLGFIFAGLVTGSGIGLLKEYLENRATKATPPVQ